MAYKKPTDEELQELLRKAGEPAKRAPKWHERYRGKIEIAPKCPVPFFDLSYTPGVAQVCKEIAKDPLMVFQYTNKGNTVLVISDGTRILGLGDIGPEAGLPVMEGKVLIFKYCGGVDAYPICVDTKDPDEIIKLILQLQPSFGAVNMEDFAQPKCFYILDELRRRAHIPVWHDDQQGTAAVNLAGLISGLIILGRKLSDVNFAMVGAGAANTATLRLLLADGVDPAKVVMTDINGILHPDRNDFPKNDPRYRFCQITNKDNRRGGIPEAMRGAHVVFALSTPGPGVIKKEWIKSMAKDRIVFACANPIPEIWPWELEEAGVEIFATGRSDFPNQINNSLGFPGILRGTLDVGASTITDEMAIAAAHELAQYAQDKGIHKGYFIPKMEEWDLYPRVAAAVGLKAIEQGVARIKLSKAELLKQATEIIERARRQAEILMDKDTGIIAPSPFGLN